jgi:hypothetical protein
MHDVVAGAMAGLTATAPMTAVMVAAHEALPVHQRHGLPPEQVTANAARSAGADEAAHRRPKRVLATIPVHFGFGAAMGAVYGALAPHVPGPGAVKGVAFGLAVWAGSYLGWLPAMGLHRSAAREPAGRNAMMIGAHVVWGVVTGMLSELAHQEKR